MPSGLPVMMGQNIMSNTNPYVQDLIATMEKKPFLKMLREWREDATTKIEADLIADVIDQIQSGDFDG